MPSVTYKCPNCDAPLVFTPGTQGFYCDFCKSAFTKEELDSKAGTETQSETTAPKEEGGHAVCYSCPSCGAQIVTDETTAATTCYYCHNPVILSGRLQGEMEPDLVIPFAIEREEAQESFSKWLKKKWFIPTAFRQESRVEELRGVYFPYWLADCKVEGELHANATKVSSWRSGDYVYTKTQRFAVRRAGSVLFDNLVKNALQKANRQLIEGVQPFEIGKTQVFSLPYLAGFQAQARDIDAAQVMPEIESEAREGAQALMRDTIVGYTTVQTVSNSLHLTDSRMRYALFPVWTLTYRSAKGELYYYALNGQTGNVCGKLPISYAKLGILLAAVAVPVFLLGLLGGLWL